MEAEERGERKHHERRLSWYVDDDGTWIFRARLAAEQGALDYNMSIQSMLYREQRTRPPV